MSEINSKIPQGPLAEKWTNYKNHQKLVNPANKRRLDRSEEHTSELQSH